MYEYDDYLIDQREHLSDLMENDFPFLSAVNTLVEDEILNRIKSTVEDYENKLIEFEKSAKIKEQHEKEIRLLKREIKDQHLEFEKKLKKESRRNVFGLDSGDEIWHIKSVGQRVPCKRCNATGILRAVVVGDVDGIELKCPKCNGNKDKYESEDKVVNAFVSQITFKSWNDGKNNQMDLYLYPRSGRGGNSYEINTDYTKVFKTEGEANGYLEEQRKKVK